MFKYILTAILFFLLSSGLKAETINDIIVQNNDRVSKQTIINFSNIKPGTIVDNEIINQALKDLYDTNFFKDISIELVDNNLVIKVVENKIIQSIIINGVKAKKFREAITKAIKLKEKSPYLEYYAESDINLIKDVLIRQGFYFAEINSYLENNNNNTVNIIYDIDQGDRALLKEIVFTGDRIFKSNKLRNIITSEENKFWKFISNKKFLNNDQIKLDERLLKRFYLNNGYYNVEISSVFAKLLDSGDFRLSFNIDAGNKYKINKTSLILPQDYDVTNFDDVNKTLKKIEDSDYSFIKLNDVVDEIDKISLKKEYEFINAEIAETIIEPNLINISIVISETKKNYVEKINIYGNNITEESVIRNELVVDEGDPINELLQAKSINNVKSLNIFKDVKSKINPGSTEQQKIIDITVEEKPTGEISLGAGVGTDGGTIGFSISENNYLGKGIKLNSSLRLSGDTIRGQFSVANPNFRYSDRAVFTNIQSTQADKLSTNGYKSNKTGFSLGTKFERYEDFYFNPSISVFHEKIETDSTASKALKKQEGTDFETSFIYSIDYDKRNQRFMTSDGYRSQFSQGIPLISDSYALKNSYELALFNKLPNEMITNISFFGSIINSVTDKDVKISDRLSLPRTKLKGFEYGKIGPKDGSDFIGGNYATSINLSTTLPMFLQSLDSADVSYFIDAGNVWGVDYSSTIDDSNKIRSSTGISVNWFTPIGPLNFSLAQPITKLSTDKTQSFQFNLGTTF